MGDHAVSCHDLVDIISRHYVMRKKNQFTQELALLSPICEQKNLLSDNNSRPFFLPVWNASQPASFDVTVTSPLHSNLNNNASEMSGFALSADEVRKYEQYAQKCSEVGIQFILLPFAFFWRIFRDSS